MAILGLDIGTTGCKATVFSSGGEILSYAYEEYPIESPRAGWFELDPERVWRAAARVIYKANRDSAEAVHSICTSSLGESFVCLNEHGDVLCGSMLYLDERGQQESEWIIETLGEARILQSTGHAPYSMYSLPKLLWLKKHRPEVYQKTRWLHFFGDYILFRLTGEHVTEYSLAARSLCFDVRKKRWDRGILEAVDLNASIFPTPLVAGSVVGSIRAEATAETGLSERTVAVLGAHDQIMCAIGSGALRDGEAVNSIGTVDCITPVFSGVKLNEQMMKSGYACIPFLFDDTYVTYAFSMTGGSLLRWFRDTFARDVAAEAERSHRSVYALLDEAMPKEPTSILTLPHFAGSPIPCRDTCAKGAMLNLSFDARREDIYRACMEGETFEMRNNLTYLEQHGIPVHMLKTVGGGSRSDKFMQIRADILDLPVMTMECEEAGTLGTAILAGTATGVFSSIKEACGKLSRVNRVFEPIAQNRDFYRMQFEKYKSLYELLKPVR